MAIPEAVEGVGNMVILEAVEILESMVLSQQTETDASKPRNVRCAGAHFLSHIWLRMGISS
ncbi:hypothetical protein KC865_00875 [Candidatus Kaiserbacteria bacterium]|nr:hypothetical protein [Candidatus Kaiserbacteria bacterium]USN92589.1 MAG: hypothetical protein H6782_02110 [Candidatus Nomurabacteria bacterium]